MASKRDSASVSFSRSPVTSMAAAGGTTPADSKVRTTRLGIPLPGRNPAASHLVAGLVEATRGAMVGAFQDSADAIARPARAIAAATPGHHQRANAASSGLNGPSDAAMDAFSDTRP